MNFSSDSMQRHQPRRRALRQCQKRSAFRGLAIGAVCVSALLVAPDARPASGDTYTPARAYQVFQEYCEKQGGLKVFETVENVDGVYVPLGIYDSGPYTWGLVKEGYRFIELRARRSSPMNDGLYATDRAYYRHTLAEPGSSSCIPFEKTFSPIAATVGLDLIELYGGRCLATDPIAGPTAKYSVFRTFKALEVDETGEAKKTTIRSVKTTGGINDFATIYSSSDRSKIYAEFHTFQYVPMPGEERRPFTELVCPVSKGKLQQAPGPSVVFKPVDARPTVPLAIPWDADTEEKIKVALILLTPPTSEDANNAVKVIRPSADANQPHRAAQEYERLCREKSGVHVFEKIEGVHGILDASSETRCDFCAFALLTSGYEFVEYHATEKLIPKFFASHYIDSRGLYRFTLEEANHPNCRLFYKFFAPRIKRGLGTPENFGGKCVATWKVREFKAKYKITQKRTDKNYDDGSITIRTWSVSDVTEDKALGEYNRIVLYPYRVPGDPKSLNRRDIESCGGGKTSGDVMAETLVPIKEQ